MSPADDSGVTVDTTGALAAPPEHEPQPVAAVRARLSADLLVHVVTWVSLAATLLSLTYAGGGRDAPSVTVAITLSLVALAANRGWRLPVGTLALAGLLTTASLVVCLVTPTGFRIAGESGAYGCAAAAFLVVRAYAVTPRLRLAVAAAVCVAGAMEFAWSFVPWWGGGNPDAAMVGTFYWHNQFAAFLVPAVVLGSYLAARGTSPWRSAGWLAVPFAVAGIVHSTSRASMAVAVAGVLAVALVLALDAQRIRSAVRMLMLAALSAGVTVGVGGPPFFASGGSALAGTLARSGVQSLGQNGGYRVEFWREALAAFVHHPILGVGYGGLVEASSPFVPTTWVRSPLAHEGVLQALADGGLLLGIPLLGCLLAAGWGLLRALRHGDLAQRVAAVAALGLLAHSLVDTDWSYPALAALLGVVLALAVPAADPEPVTAAVPVHGVRALASAVLALALVAAAFVGRVGIVAINAPLPTVNAETTGGSPR